MEIQHTENDLQQAKTHNNNRNVESNVIKSTNENTKDVNKNELMNDKMKHEVNINDMLNHKK